jgi:ribonucleotide monophosphatase NagD (HAD superfamily)
LGLKIDEMAMVGDGLYNDIALGLTSGIITCLVLSGETRREDLSDSPYQPAYIFNNLGELGDWLRTHSYSSLL